MEELAPDSRHSKYVPIKYMDILDFLFLMIEAGVDLTLLEFCIDLLPCSISEVDILDYFTSFSFHSKKQMDDIYRKSDIILNYVEQKQAKI